MKTEKKQFELLIYINITVIIVGSTVNTSTWLYVKWKMLWKYFLHRT